MHYQRWLHNGDPLATRQGGNKKGCVLPERVKINADQLLWDYEVNRLSSDALAEKHGCSSPTILIRLRKAGAVIRHHNDTKRGAPSPKRTKINVAKAARLYAEKNASISSVAREIGVATKALRRAFMEKGVRIKGLSEVIDGTRYGERNPNWNPDLSSHEREQRRPTRTHTAWRCAVYERDDFTCQACGDDRGGNLNAHHLSSYHADKARRWDVSNGVTLCDVCHRAFHKAHGYKNNTEAQFRAFLLGAAKLAA